MKHIAQIQIEFLKEARKWDDLTYEEQKGYLERHPKTKRKITARPASSESAQQTKTETSQKTDVAQPAEENSSVKLTKVQQKVFDACEPLIKNLQDHAVTHYNKILENFEKELKKQKQQPDAKNIDFYKFVDGFASNKPDISQFLKTVYSYSGDRYSIRHPLVDYTLNDANKKRFYDRTKEAIKEYNTYKLSGALHKYITPDFTDIKNIQIDHGATGFEISAKLIDDQNRQWNFNTKAISAGGYNIQVWHYRYLINLSSPEVPREVVRQRVSEAERQEKDARKQQRLQEHQERKRLKAAKVTASVFAEIKHVVKEWVGWGKNHFRQAIASGHRSQTEFDGKQAQIDRLKRFIAKYDLKRPQLMQKILDGDITPSTFDEIDDILYANSVSFYAYRKLKHYRG